MNVVRARFRIRVHVRVQGHLRDAVVPRAAAVVVRRQGVVARRKQLLPVVPA